MGKMTPAEWDMIILSRAYGKSNIEIAKSANVSKSIISSVLKAFDAVKASDWDTCIELINNWRLGIDLFKWAAEKTGVTLPEMIYTAYNDRNAAHRAKLAKNKIVEPEADPVTAENERVFTLKMLEYIAKTNELLEQLMDVVMPKYCGDLKDNVNANCDIICERLKSCEDKLEAIKANTRKRGL